MTVPTQALLDLAETITTLPHEDFATFQQTFLDKMIRKIPGVMGGASCIRKTGIAVWTLISLMKKGADNEKILLDYPSLTSLDLWAVQLYYSHNCQEIDNLIALHHETDSLSQQNLTAHQIQPSDWSSFIGSFEAESDLSVNYKQYLLEGLEQKYGYH